MDRFKIQAFLRQFPFLCTMKLDDARYGSDEFTNLSPNNAEEVKVSRISPEFLHTRAWFKGATGSSVDIDDSERIFLLGKDGTILLEVEQSCDIVHNSAHEDDQLEERETVGEALLRLKNPDDVVYAVSIHTGYEIRNHHSVGGSSLTLYKAPKGFTLRGWVEEQERRAMAQVEAMVAIVDAEA